MQLNLLAAFSLASALLANLAWTQTCTPECTFTQDCSTLKSCSGGSCASNVTVHCCRYDTTGCTCGTSASGDCCNCGVCYYYDSSESLCRLTFWHCAGTQCIQASAGRAVLLPWAQATTQAPAGGITIPIGGAQVQVVNLDAPQIEIAVSRLEPSSTGLGAVEYLLLNHGQKALRAVTVEWQFYFGDKPGPGALDVFDRWGKTPISPGETLTGGFGGFDSASGDKVTRVVAQVTYAESIDGVRAGPKAEEAFKWLTARRTASGKESAGVREGTTLSASVFGMLNTNPASSRPDRRPSICSRLVAGVSCSSASGWRSRKRRNESGTMPRHDAFSVKPTCNVPD